MGKHKKKSSKKQFSSDKGKKSKNYLTRKEYLLSFFDPYLFELWFQGNQEKIDSFGRFLIEQEHYQSEAALDELSSTDSYYETKLKKTLKHKCTSINDIMDTLNKISKLHDKIESGKKYKKMYRKKDLGIAVYLNSERYKKKLLNKSKYRKELKKIAARERDEINTARKLGYIKSKDPDKELKKLLTANNKMAHALSDAYTQKHFID